jgi:hypothetical protein
MGDEHHDPARRDFGAHPVKNSIMVLAALAYLLAVGYISAQLTAPAAQLVFAGGLGIGLLLSKLFNATRKRSQSRPDH